MNKYAPKDIELNIIAWNKIHSYWDKMGYYFVDQVIELEESYEYNQKAINDTDNLMEERIQKCKNIHHNMIKSMSSTVSDEWFKTEIDKKLRISTIPKVVKKLIKQYAQTHSLADDDDFKTQYDKRLQKIGQSESP